MLLRASGLISDGLYLLTLGSSCHYLFGTEDHFFIFDPGLSAHTPMLVKRINNLNFSIKNCKAILFTHLDADRVSAAAYLKELNPEIEIIATIHMKEKLQDREFMHALFLEDKLLSAKYELPNEMKLMSFENFQDKFRDLKVVADSEYLTLSGNYAVRIVPFPAHRSESLAYLMSPMNYLIGDEGFGYYRARQYSAPGCDYSLDNAVHGVMKFTQLNPSGLCMSQDGVLTAELVKKHLSSMSENLKEIKSEVEKARKNHVSNEIITSSIKNSFYISTSSDPLLVYNMEKSFGNFCHQLSLT